MEIRKIREENKLTLELVGRLDTMTAPDLEAVTKSELGGVKELVLEMKELEYLSSAGLRVLLSTLKVMNKQSSMVVRDVCETIMEVFEVTGFSDIMTIE